MVIGTHEFFGSTFRWGWRSRVSWAESTFIFAELAMRDSIADKVFGNASMVLAREFPIIARRGDSRMFRKFLAESAFIVSIFAVPSSIAYKVVGNAGSVQTHETVSTAQIGGPSWLLSGAEFRLVLSSRAMEHTVTYLNKRRIA